MFKVPLESRIIMMWLINTVKNEGLVYEGQASNTDNVSISYCCHS